jgi:hypothetical protein
VERVPNGTSLFRLAPRTGDLAAFRQRLGARGVALPPPAEGGFWLKVNESLRGADPAALLAAFTAAL